MITAAAQITKDVVFFAPNLWDSPRAVTGKIRNRESREIIRLPVNRKDNAYAIGKIRAKTRNCHFFAEHINAAPHPIDIMPPKINAGSMGEPTKDAENAIKRINKTAFESFFAEINKITEQSRQITMDTENTARLFPHSMMGKRREVAITVKKMKMTGNNESFS